MEVTETVLRISSGGDNFVRVAKVANLAQAIQTAKDEEFWIAGAVVKDGQDLTDIEFQFPLALVVGSEQKGIREVIRKYLDVPITIPMAHPRMSLNVAHATAIMCFEILRQKNGERRTRNDERRTKS